MPHSNLNLNLHSQSATAALLTLLASTHAASDATHDFCVVGGGPGGLQTAGYLAEQGNDYILFESKESEEVEPELTAEEIIKKFS